MEHLIAISMYLQTHITGVLLAIAASYVVGFLWHGPLFGAQWMAWNNITPPRKEDMKFFMMLPGLSANFVLVFIQSAVLGRAFQILLLPNITYAFIIATILWLPFTGLTIVNSYAWLGKPVKLMVLDAAYYLVSLWVIAAVLYATL
ncbi:hypothetical protein A3C37_01050 [Candidatus Peribacteria bacterium RIFCSPHIGHO2_02_FULL_53_20]|nr:MAG: hypothetical protein A3C37_01050 [Candidatus Peribacteria bacterium RIFCSPHIGHO2_02_FULL_53_20]OGJ71044.1 MAG: hypothetical protein A3G69_05260 [Candidatus Peribacteria bacterium RIFCSPLOWO2_12_FULL_53_10]